MTIKLYGFPGTRTNRVQWLLEEIGLPYEYEKIQVFEGEHKRPPHMARHPHGVVPAADIDGATFIESGAMLLHFADLKGTLAPPVGTPERMRYYQFVIYASAQLDKPAVEYFFNTTFRAPEDRDHEKAKRAKPVLEAALGFLGRELEGREYLLGDTFSAADVAVGYDLSIMAASGLLTNPPRVQAYFGKLAARPAFEKVFGQQA